MGRALDKNWPMRVSSMSLTPPRGDHRETHMTQLVMMIAQIDELDNPDTLTEL